MNNYLIVVPFKDEEERIKQSPAERTNFWKEYAQRLYFIDDGSRDDAQRKLELFMRL